MPTRRFQPLKAKDSQTDQAYSEISQVIDALAPLEQYALRTEARVSAAAGTVLRLAPRASGQEVVIPPASGSNFNQTITLYVEGALGELRVRAASGRINGASAYTLAAGYTTLLVLRSNGQTGWVNERATTMPIAGNALEYAGETLNYVGSTSTVEITGVSGNLGTVDISALECGGALIISAAAGDYQIEGFTDKPDGFWFTLAASNTAVLATIRNEDSTPSPSTRKIRVTGGVDFVATNLQGTVHKADQRWRFVGGGPESGRLLARTVYTSGTAATHNHPFGARTCVVRLQGGGGGGNGRPVGTAGNCGCGTGGAAGAYGERTFTLTATTSTYTVGAAGAAGDNAGSNGATGGSTTFTHDGTVATAPGGTGASSEITNGSAVAVSGAADPSAACTGCDFASNGGSGHAAFRLSGTVIVGGSGGNSGFGAGGRARNSQGNGLSATGFGAGGAGGVSIETGGAVTGGAGSGGFIVVEDYS